MLAFISISRLALTLPVPINSCSWMALYCNCNHYSPCIEQLLLYVVLIWICYNHHCCRHHKRPGQHHGPGSVQARLAAVALARCGVLEQHPLQNTLPVWPQAHSIRTSTTITT